MTLKSTKIFWNGGFMMKQVGDVAKEACRECAEDLLERSQELVPRDTDFLHDSARVVDASSSGKAEFYVTYTDYDPKHDYDNAVRQHEDLVQNHPNGGQAKYLEEPMDAMMHEYKQFIANAIQEELDRKKAKKNAY